MCCWSLWNDEEPAWTGLPFWAKVRSSFSLAGLMTLLAQDSLLLRGCASLPLASLPQVNHTLQVLGLRCSNVCWEGAQSLADALSANTTLRALDLQDNAIGDQGAEGLAGALARNGALRHLNVANCGVGPRGASAIAAALAGSRLEELNLAGNEVGPAGARAMAGALRVNCHLLELGMRYSGIGDAGAEDIASALSAHEGLCLLELQECGVGPRGARSLAAMLRTNSRLQTLRCVQTRGPAQTSDCEPHRRFRFSVQPASHSAQDMSSGVALIRAPSDLADRRFPLQAERQPAGPGRHPPPGRRPVGKQRAYCTGIRALLARARRCGAATEHLGSCRAGVARKRCACFKSPCPCRPPCALPESEKLLQLN